MDIERIKTFFSDHENGTRIEEAVKRIWKNLLPYHRELSEQEYRFLLGGFWTTGLPKILPDMFETRLSDGYDMIGKKDPIKDLRISVKSSKTMFQRKKRRGNGLIKGADIQLKNKLGVAGSTRVNFDLLLAIEYAGDRCDYDVYQLRYGIADSGTTQPRSYQKGDQVNCNLENNDYLYLSDIYYFHEIIPQQNIVKGWLEEVVSKPQDLSKIKKARRST